MGILAEKSHIALLSVGVIPRGMDRMPRNMERHGVPVDARTVTRSGSIAETVLSEADNDDARRIVMGAFKRAKSTNDVFGGVTTDLIAGINVRVYVAN